MVHNQIIEPIEGFFIKSVDGLIFDVKELSQPLDRVIAFVRYIPSDLIEQEDNERRGFVKLYDLKERYSYLSEHFPKYLFEDPKGRGLLQGVTRDEIIEIYDPRKKLELLVAEDYKINSLEYLTSLLTRKILDYSSIELNSIGISGSLLVDLHTQNSDIDLVIYGEKNGLAVYEAMKEVFDNVEEISRYSRKELQKLWKERGQEEQIGFKSFVELEQKKHLQGKILGIDFYIRCVPYPSETSETYDNTLFVPLGEIDIECTIEDNSKSIFTPCVYSVSDVIILNKSEKTAIPERIYSLRGRYCDLAKQGERVHVKGKLEQVNTNNKKQFYQIILGTTTNEFFVRK